MKKLLLLSFTILFIKAGKTQNTVVGGNNTNFETNTNIIHIDTTSGNIWQIGLPQKTFFGTSHSVPYSIMTDSINSYPINNFSTFTVEYGVPIGFGMIPGASIEFWHKYETDSKKDGGYVEISVDSGSTWINVTKGGSIGLNTWNQINFYNSFSDTITGNIPAFTGTQSTWIYSFIHLQWLIGVENNRNLSNIKKVMFRFNFKSDNIQTNKAGWIIDDIAIKIYDVGGGVHENELANFDVQVFPNPIKEKGIIQVVPKNNEHDFTISIYNALGQLIATSKMDKNNQYILNANDLTSGMYFYSVKSKDGTFKSGKLMIN